MQASDIPIFFRTFIIRTNIFCSSIFECLEGGILMENTPNNSGRPSSGDCSRSHSLAVPPSSTSLLAPGLKNRTRCASTAQDLKRYYLWRIFFKFNLRHFNTFLEDFKGFLCNVYFETLFIWAILAGTGAKNQKKGRNEFFELWMDRQLSKDAIISSPGFGLCLPRFCDFVFAQISCILPEWLFEGPLRHSLRR